MPRIAWLSVSVASFLLCSGTPMRTEPAPQGAATAPQLGQVNFPTSCATEAQPSMEMGVALLHSFQYEQADQSFSEAAKRDPKCAMAYWGKAMSRYEQLWEFPSKKTLKLAAQDIQRAQSLGAASERERGYIAAAATFYLRHRQIRESKSGDRRTRSSLPYGAQQSRTGSLPDSCDGHARIRPARSCGSARLLENRAGLLARPAHAVAHFRPAGSMAGIHIVQHRGCRIRCQGYAGAPLRPALPIPRTRLSELFLPAKRTRIQGSRDGERAGQRARRRPGIDCRASRVPRCAQRVRVAPLERSRGLTHPAGPPRVAGIDVPSARDWRCPFG